MPAKRPGLRLRKAGKKKWPKAAKAN